MNPIRQRQGFRNENGQILMIYALVIPLLLLFAGIAIDFGFAYVTKMNLSKAVDAAALAGMRNYGKGQSQATAMALDAFNANYQSSSSLSLNPPTVNIAVTTDANSNRIVNVSATVAMNTFFIRLLPSYGTLNISSSAQTTAPRLIMSLVLDKSGSMNLNGGAQALPPAVINFLGDFDNSTDEVAEVSFSTLAKVDVPIETNFMTPITNAVNSMTFGGATFSQAGLQDGQTQINSVTVVSGENVVKVAVFFTDGWANTVQNDLSCPPVTLLNFGGCSPPEAAVGWCSGISFMNPTTGNMQSCGATSFPSQQTGTNLPLTQTNIANEAMYRSVQVANSMRAQNIVVYSIGLGDKISEPFLQQVANDPASTTYDPTQPVGAAVFAPTPAELSGVFQTIAAKIVLRISQ